MEDDTANLFSLFFVTSDFLKSFMTQGSQIKSFSGCRFTHFALGFIF
jgi:hypothetical protein